METETWDERIDRERKERKERYFAMRTKLEKVAELLGHTINSDKSTGGDEMFYCVMVSTDKIFIRWQTEGPKNRLEIRGEYPSDNKGGCISDVYYDSKKDGQTGKVARPCITLDPNKTPEQIAKDIQRRFMPDYGDYLARIQKIVDSHNDYEDTTAAALEDVAGRKLTEDEKNSRKIDGYLVKGNYEGGRYEVKASRKTIDIELNGLTIEKAKAVLKIVGYKQ